VVVLAHHLLSRELGVIVPLTRAASGEQTDFILNVYLLAVLPSWATHAPWLGQ